MEEGLSRQERGAAGVLLALPALAAILYLAVSEWSYPVSAARRWLAAWGLASAVAAGLAFSGRRPRLAAGIGLMLVPVVMGILGFLNTFELLITRGTVAPPRSPYQLSGQYSRAILIDIGYLGTGFLLWSGWRPGHGLTQLAARLRDATPRIMGRGEGRSALSGYALFPLLLGGAWLMDWIINNHVPAVVTGDDTRVWSRMTPYHAVMLAAAAAVTEELLYRAFILGGTAHVLRSRGASDTTALGVGMVVQTLIFGMTHGGYGDLQIVLQATTFAVLAGLAAIFLGIWAAIVLHFLIDFFVFGSYVAGHSQAMLVVLWVLLAVNVVVAGWVGWTSWHDRRRAPAEPAR